MGSVQSRWWLMQQMAVCGDVLRVLVACACLLCAPVAAAQACQQGCPVPGFVLR